MSCIQCNTPCLPMTTLCQNCYYEFLDELREDPFHIQNMIQLPELVEFAMRINPFVLGYTDNGALIFQQQYNDMMTNASEEEYERWVVQTRIHDGLLLLSNLAIDVPVPDQQRTLDKETCYEILAHLEATMPEGSYIKCSDFLKRMFEKI